MRKVTVAIVMMLASPLPAAAPAPVPARGPGPAPIPAPTPAPPPPPPRIAQTPATPATTSRATTSPATKPLRLAEMEPLLDGSIRYVPPDPAAGWKFIGKTDDNLKATYIIEEGRGRIDINVSPQTRDVPDTYAKQMALIIGKGIREDADRVGRTLLLPPKIEKDDRFFLKVHDRISGEDGVRDRLQLYRVMGLNIVHVAVIALKDTPEEAKPIHVAAEELLDGMVLTHGQRPVVYPRNKLKIRPPVDWKETRTDAPNGLVVTYSDPKQPARQLIVRARVIPKVAIEDQTKRNAFIDRMVDDERRTPPFSNTIKPIGEDQIIPGGAPREYLRQVRTDAQSERGEKLRVQTRYFIVNDEMVSLRSVCSVDDEALLKLADAVAVEVKPSRE